MKERILTGFIGGAAFLIFLYLGGKLFASLISLLTVIAYIELMKMAKIRLWSFPSLLGIVGVITPLLSTFLFLGDHSFLQGFERILISVAFLLLIYIVISKNQFTFEQAGICLLGIIYIGVGFYALIDTRISSGLAYFVFILILIWTTDSGAYFTGRYIGKNRLWPSISPNKTIEGALGGVGFAILAGLLFQLFTSFFNGYMTVIWMSLLISLVGQLGDLVESAIKRYYEVKDSGSLLPGHGGILDRFDSLLFVFLILYLLQMH